MQLTKAAPIANLEKPCKNKYILNTFLWTLLSSCISTTIILTMHHTPHVTYIKQTWIKWIIVLSILPPIYVMHISKYIIARKISYVCFTLAISMFASLSIMPILNNTVIITSITLTACLLYICIQPRGRERPAPRFYSGSTLGAPGSPRCRSHGSCDRPAAAPVAYP